MLLAYKCTKMTHCVSIIYCQAKLSVSIIYLSDKTLCFNQIFVRQNSLFQSYISQTKLSVSIIYLSVKLFVSIIYLSDKTLCFYHIFVRQTLCFYHIFFRQTLCFNHIFFRQTLCFYHIFFWQTLCFNHILVRQNSLFQSYVCQTKLSVSFSQTPTSVKIIFL